MYGCEKMSEKVLIVGLKMPENRHSYEDSMQELEALAESAVAEVLGRVDQSADRIDSKTFIGSGKAVEIGELAENMEIDTVIINHELSGSQIKNLEDVIGKKIIDRTNLILDIFALRAKSVESVLQVELAQANYRLPRLVGYRNYLSRTGGGIGTRGPGEQKLETDRRHIRREIASIKARLKKQVDNRGITRKQRKSSELPVVALLGYTNAGKSTIMNRLIEYTGRSADKKVYADDRLFATLDTRHIRIMPEEHESFILADTVGLIRDIPVNLIEAFKSTLEEIKYADLILVVLDASTESLDRQKSAINETIEDLKIGGIPIIEVYNKMDLVGDDLLLNSKNSQNEVIYISALEDGGIEKLLQSIDRVLNQDSIEVEIIIPYSEPALINQIIEKYKPQVKKSVDNGMQMSIMISRDDYDKLERYVI